MLERFEGAYMAGRTQLKRVICCNRDGKRAWPWLIDFGFRQPFVELDDDADLDSVLEANADQVMDLEIEE